MAYFGDREKGNIFSRVQPRIILLVLWLAACIGFLSYIANGVGWFVPQTAVAAKESHQDVPVLPQTTQIKMANVLVPRQAILAGEKLSKDLFLKEERPVKGIETIVVEEFSEIEGGYASALIAANAPLVKDYITFNPPSNAVITKIPNGYRGVTIAVNEESAVEGWVRPGARVDVILSTMFRGKPTVTTIVENASVLSAERSTDITKDTTADKSPPRFVTLLVNLKEAQRIQLAKASGSLSLTLRGLSDEKEMGKETISSDTLLRSASEKDHTDDFIGWVQVEGKQFNVDSRGKLNPSDRLAETRSIVSPNLEEARARARFTALDDVRFE